MRANHKFIAERDRGSRGVFVFDGIPNLIHAFSVSQPAKILLGAALNTGGRNVR